MMPMLLTLFQIKQIMKTENFVGLHTRGLFHICE